MGEYTRIYVDEAKKSTKICKQEIREFFARGENPPNWPTSLSSRSSQREVVSISFFSTHPPTTFFMIKEKNMYYWSLHGVYPMNC